MNFLQKKWTFYGRISDEKTALLHFRTSPPPSPLPIVIDDSSWKSAAESFTVALTLTLGGYESATVPKKLASETKVRIIWWKIRPGGVKNLFNLDDFSNYVSSN